MVVTDGVVAGYVTAGGPTQKALDTRYAHSSAYVGACIGDSISERNGAWGSEGTSAYWGRESWLMQASAANGWSVTLGAGNVGASQHGNNFAVAGTRTDQMLASQLPSVVALNPAPGFCTLVGGTNDISQGYSSASVITNLDAMVTALTLAGIPVILGTVLPNTSYTVAQQTAVYEVNRWIIKQPELRRGVYVADFYTALVGAGGNAAAPLPNALTSDGTHQSAYGAALMARVLAPILATLFPQRTIFPGPGDPKSLGPNPFMVGTGGPLGTGVTGVVATDWYAADAGGSPSLSTVGSKVARTDGVPGEWQQFAFTAGSLRFLPAVDTTGFVVGDTVHACVEFQTDPNFDTSGCTQLETYIQSTGSANTSGYLTNTGVQYDGTEVPLTTFPRSGVMRTPPMTVGAGTTGLEVWVRANNLASPGTLRIGRIALVKEN
jgi:lysophospholipase L1-like esterase